MSIATIENMQKHWDGTISMYSFNTLEEYSANPGDYFWAPPGHVFTDDLGEPMELVRKREVVTKL